MHKVASSAPRSRPKIRPKQPGNDHDDDRDQAEADRVGERLAMHNGRKLISELPVVPARNGDSRDQSGQRKHAPNQPGSKSQNGTQHQQQHNDDIDKTHSAADSFRLSMPTQFLSRFNL